MKVLVAGDFSPKYRVAKMFLNKSAKSLFYNVENLIREADYSIVNFETVVTDTEDKPIRKIGPNLHCTEEAVHTLKEIGFNCLTLANNHFRDFGSVAVKKSLQIFADYKLDSVGGGVNIQEAQKVLYKQFDDFVLAIVNICETEFSIATETRGGCAPIDTLSNFLQIKEAKEKADIVMLIIHGGCEHYQYPTPRMKNLYRYFIEIGADFVINHHQHCFSGYEIYKGRPIFYGLGNFCFDNPNRRNSNWNKGYMVQIDMNKDSYSFDIIPYSQCEEDPSIVLMEGNDKSNFDNAISNINSIIQNDTELNKKLSEFMKLKRRAVAGAFSPYSSDYLRAAAGKGFLPSCMSANRALSMYNYIICESQRDCTIKCLLNYFE